jgi:hypothetical protein
LDECQLVARREKTCVARREMDFGATAEWPAPDSQLTSEGLGIQSCAPCRLQPQNKAAQPNVKAMEFIKVISQAGHPVYVNVDHIVTIEKDGEWSRVDLDADFGQDKFLLVKDTPEQIMELINVGHP